ncbi:RICIN domain-containing protein [Streptomyces sp. NPDC003393]
MTLWTSLEPASATVGPGGSTTVRLRLRNTGDVVDEYLFEPTGPIAPWTRVVPQTLRLYPGTTGTVELTFEPPRTPDATAGPNPYAVRITPTEHPEAVTVPEGNLTITPFTEVRAELVPPAVKGRFRGRPRLAVDNLGNTKLTASVSGSDTGDQLSFDIRPSNVQLEPGRAAFVKATLRPRQIIWFGSKEQRPYVLSVLRSGAEPLPVDGMYIQRGFLPRWLATFFGVLLALTITFVMLWIAYAPQISSKTVEKIAEAGTTLAPSRPPTLPAAPPLSSASPPGHSPVEPSPAESPKAHTAGGGGEGGESTPPPVVPAKNILLRNTHSHKCANIPYYDGGQPKDAVDQWTCDATDQDNQLWNLDVKDRNGGPGGRPLFLVENAKAPHLCMDLDGLGAQPHTTPVQIYTCDGTTANNQLWWLDKQSSGAYWIRNYASSNLCLDVSGRADGSDGKDDTAEGEKLTIYDCSNDDDQEWEIVRPSHG